MATVDLPSAAPPRNRPVVLFTLATCLIAALAFAGAVTVDALVIYVLGAVLIGAGAALLVRSSTIVGVAIGCGAGLVWAEIVNLLGGDASGPIARSSFAAAVCTAFAVRLVTGRAPATFLMPVGTMLASAMVLGASGEVTLVAVLTIAACTATLAVAEGRVRRWLLPAPIWRSVTAMAVVLGAIGLALAATQAVIKPGQGTTDRDAALPTIAPPWQPTSQPTVPTTQPTATPEPTTSPTTPPTPPPEEETSRVLVFVGLLLLLLLLLVLIVYLVRRWLVARRFRRRRAALASGSAADRAVGAWVWSLEVLRARGYSVPLSLSPDRFADVDSMSGLAPELFADLESIAAPASAAAFSSGTVSESAADLAWRSVADLEDRIATDQPGRGRRR